MPYYIWKIGLRLKIHNYTVHTYIYVIIILKKPVLVGQMEFLFPFHFLVIVFTSKFLHLLFIQYNMLLASFRSNFDT